MRNLPDRRRRYMRLRIAMLGGFLFFFAGLVLWRAHHWQIELGDDLREKAENQYLRNIPLSPKRGTIRDRHGAPLAVSVQVDSVAADPVALQNANADPIVVARQLAHLLDVDEARLRKQLGSKRRFVWVKRRVSAAEGKAVRQLNLSGVLVAREAQRYYPHGSLASHVLGFANIDGKGIEGVELALDDRLRGSVERVPAIRDRKGNIVFSQQLLDDRAAAGDEVMLTLDKTIQHLAEHELELAVRTFEARAGSIVAMDPNTGEVLAMANYPTYNPNSPADYPAANRRNRSVTDRFEPGSTVKPFTVAGALARGAIKPHAEIDCEDGKMQVAEYVIHDSHKWDKLTPAQILVNSSNIGTAKIGLSLGRPGLHQVLRSFGFGQSTGIALPGETAGILRHHKKWYDMDAATISFGQGMSATALQLTTAMSALANGGKLMHPVLVKTVRDAAGDVVQDNIPRVRRRVVPQRVARLVSDMMTGVTGKGGTGEEAAIEGYLVAGKTGTAQKADYVHGGYAEDLWSSSFVGYAPADKPRLVVAVVIDEPMIAHYGGTVAAPAFRRVTEQALRHLGVPADHQGSALSAQLARKEVEKRQAGEAQIEQAEPPPAELSQGEVRVPSLLGMHARQAISSARKLGFHVRVHGSGLVARQTPRARTGAAPGSSIELHLEPPHTEKVVTETESPEEPLSKVAADGEVMLAKVGDSGAAP